MNSADNSRELLSLNQLTNLTSVSSSTIRHWEREFQDYLQSVRTSGNQRRFPPDAVEKIERIKSLVKEQGLTLAGVRMRLEQLAETKDTNAPLRDEQVEQLASLVSDHVLKQLFGNNSAKPDASGSE